jgi:hypothetical protein
MIVCGLIKYKITIFKLNHDCELSESANNEDK